VGVCGREVCVGEEVCGGGVRSSCEDNCAGSRARHECARLRVGLPHWAARRRRRGGGLPPAAPPRSPVKGVSVPVHLTSLSCCGWKIWLTASARYLPTSARGAILLRDARRADLRAAGRSGAAPPTKLWALRRVEVTTVGIIVRGFLRRRGRVQARPVRARPVDIVMSPATPPGAGTPATAPGVDREEPGQARPSPAEAGQTQNRRPSQAHLGQQAKPRRAYRYRVVRGRCVRERIRRSRRAVLARASRMQSSWLPAGPAWQPAPTSARLHTPCMHLDHATLMSSLI
jgi:hypothetical protein